MQISENLKETIENLLDENIGKYCPICNKQLDVSIDVCDCGQEFLERFFNGRHEYGCKSFIQDLVLLKGTKQSEEDLESAFTDNLYETNGKINFCGKNYYPKMLIKLDEEYYFELFDNYKNEETNNGNLILIDSEYYYLSEDSASDYLKGIEEEEEEESPQEFEDSPKMLICNNCEEEYEKGEECPCQDEPF